MHWIIVLLLLAILAIIGMMLRQSGKSQVAVQVGRLMGEIESARSRDDTEGARRAAQELIDLLDRENLRGGVYDEARRLAQAVLS